MDGERRVRLGEIGQVARTVRDLDKAVEFYRDPLGVRFLYPFPGLALLDCGGTRLMLSEPENDSERPGPVLCPRVEDICGVARELKGFGVDFTDEPHRIAQMPDHDLWTAFSRDLDGNVLALMSEVRPT